MTSRYCQVDQALLQAWRFLSHRPATRAWPENRWNIDPRPHRASGWPCSCPAGRCWCSLYGIVSIACCSRPMILPMFSLVRLLQAAHLVLQPATSPLQFDKVLSRGRRGLETRLKARTDRQERRKNAFEILLPKMACGAACQLRARFNLAEPASCPKARERLYTVETMVIEPPRMLCGSSGSSPVGIGAHRPFLAVADRLSYRRERPTATRSIWRRARRIPRTDVYSEIRDSSQLPSSCTTASGISVKIC